jgi:hypothetical protein
MIMRIIIILLLVLSIISCEKYEQPKWMDLSGEYVIDRITTFNYENSINPNNKTYYPGDIYLNNIDSYPLDSIAVGFKRWYLNNVQIFFEHYELPSGQKKWYSGSFYSVSTRFEPSDLGYLNVEFDNGTKRVFKIVEEGLESLTLRTTGQWVSGPNGTATTMTIYLTKIGP